MYDSTNVADDPLGADLVGYYVDGIYATTAAKVRQRFPNAVLVSISAIGSNAGIVGDVEPGCMTIQQAIAWVKQRRAAGVDPTLYVNQTYGWLPAREAFTRAQVPAPHWWVANYDGRAIVPDGAVAKQYANPPLTHGHFDRSVVADYWPGVDEGLAGDPEHTTAGGIDLLPEERAWLIDVHSAVARLEKVLGSAVRNADGSYTIVADPELPNVAGWTRVVRDQLDHIEGRVELIEQSPAIGAEHTTPPGP